MTLGLLSLAFAAGMLAPVNPCGFALLPVWIAQTLGEASTSPLPIRLARALRNGAALTVGFTGTLVAAGMAISAGARTVIAAAPWLGLVLGLGLALLGVLMLAGRSLTLRVPNPVGRHFTSGPLTIRAVVLVGIGYAAASLSCTFGVLLVVIGQSLASASYVGLVAVFVAYAVGSASVLLLVSIATAVTGAVLPRRLGVLAQRGTRVTGVVVLATGAYLIWYWLPALTGDRSSNNTGLVKFSAMVSTWLQTHTSTIAALAAGVVLAVAAVAWRYRIATDRKIGMAPSIDTPDCCGPVTAEPNRPTDNEDGDTGFHGEQPSVGRQATAVTLPWRSRRN